MREENDSGLEHSGLEHSGHDSGPEGDSAEIVGLR